MPTVHHVEPHAGGARKKRFCAADAGACAFPRRSLACLLVAGPHAQEPLADAARRKTFDQLLDLYVRNGDVYYRALKSDRAKLDSYMSLIATTSVDKLSREERIAFWLNAYDAIVLRTIVDHYPIAGSRPSIPRRASARFPARSSACSTASPDAR